MKVLVVGKGSYIAKSFRAYATETHSSKKDYNISVDLADSYEEWKMVDFSQYETVIFAAGIAHRKQKKSNAHLYFSVNHDLALDVAKKAKAEKVPQFVYLSSMAVYGKKEGEISAHTIPEARHNDYYGASKLQAENALKNIEDQDFAVAIVRPPMVYGAGCPGRFGQLVKIAMHMPIVFDNNNKRSIIYIDNLSAFLCELILARVGGVFCPQNKEYANTAQLAALIRQEHGKKTVILGMGSVSRLCMALFPPFRTAFGSLYYSKDVPALLYEQVEFEDSVSRSARRRRRAGRASDTEDMHQ